MPVTLVLIAFVTSAAPEVEPGTGAVPILPPQEFRLVNLAAGLGVDGSFEGGAQPWNFALWAELELGLRPLRWFRLVLNAGLAWPPPQPPGYPGLHAILRSLAGVDVVLPMPLVRRGELFFGASGGWESSNQFWESTQFLGGPSLRFRAGADVHLPSAVSLGASAGVSLFQGMCATAPQLAFCVQPAPRLAIELRARLTYAF